MTHPRNAPPAGVSRAGADAEKAAFLRDMRALRDHAGLGARDLAARAHFPEDTLTTAEAGPALPSLPVLQAYVRGCGAGEAEWEDRWRRLNQDTASDGSSALPTRAPATARPPSRLMPFPESTGGRSATEQEAIGFGLARVVRGLAPIDRDSAAPDGSDAAGWFDPAPRPSASPSMFDPAPRPPSSSPPPPTPPAPPAPPAPEVSPGAPTVQYPAFSGYAPTEPSHGSPETGYEAPESSFGPPAEPGFPGTYASPRTYQPPEEFRTPVPEPPSAPPAPGPSATVPGLGASTTPPATAAMSSPRAAATPTAFSSTSGASSNASGASVTTSPPKAHAAPASPRRRITTQVIAAVIAVLIIGVVLWLILGH